MLDKFILVLALHADRDFLLHSSEHWYDDGIGRWTGKVVFEHCPNPKKWTKSEISFLTRFRAKNEDCSWAQGPFFLERVWSDFRQNSFLTLSPTRSPSQASPENAPFSPCLIFGIRHIFLLLLVCHIIIHHDMLLIIWRPSHIAYLMRFIFLPFV